MLLPPTVALVKYPGAAVQCGLPGYCNVGSRLAKRLPHPRLKVVPSPAGGGHGGGLVAEIHGRPLTPTQWFSSKAHLSMLETPCSLRWTSKTALSSYGRPIAQPGFCQRGAGSSRTGQKTFVLYAPWLPPGWYATRSSPSVVSSLISSSIFSSPSSFSRCSSLSRHRRSPERRFNLPLACSARAGLFPLGVPCCEWPPGEEDHAPPSLTTADIE
jgi:hypothetical protein